MALAVAGLFLIGALDDPALTRLDSGLLRFLLPGAVLVLLVVAALRGGRGLRPALLGVLLVEAAVAGPAIVEDAFHQPYQYPGTAEPLDEKPRGIQDARVFANNGNLHLWSLRSAMDGYEPLLLNWTIPLLSNPGEEMSYRRTVRMRQNRSAASLLRRRFWLVPAVVEGELPPKTRLFPPTGAVFLADASEMALPRIRLSDLPRSAVGAPGEEIVLWKAGESEARRLRAPIRIGPVALGRKSSSLFIDYRASQAVRISVSITGEGPSEDFAFGTGNGLELKPADHTIEVPLPAFERATIEIRRLSGRGPKGLAIERVRKVVDAKDESNLFLLEELTPDRVRVALHDLPGPRALVFTDAHYPGWTATLDRDPVPIHLANGAFKAVLVPEGSHEVEFTFSQSRVRLGVAVSVLTFAAAVGFVGREWWRSRRAHSM